MQSNQYEYNEKIKYGDNQGHFTILWWEKKRWKVNIFYLWSNLIALLYINISTAWEYNMEVR